MIGAALRVRGLRKTYKDVVAVDGIDLDVQPGECFGLLGPNGAGKTTTIEICEGLTEPDSGEVEVLGLRWRSDAAVLRQRLGIQLQETQLSDKLDGPRNPVAVQEFLYTRTGARRRDGAGAARRETRRARIGAVRRAEAAPRAGVRACRRAGSAIS